MDLQNEKCVMVIDENLPLGIIANTAAIMGITLGKQMPEVVGADVYDRKRAFGDYRVSGTNLKGKCGGDQVYP